MLPALRLPKRGVVGLREAMDAPRAMEEGLPPGLNQALPACLQARKARLIRTTFPP